MSALGAEPETAGQEFRVAIVGPLVSFLLAIVFAAIALAAKFSDAGGEPPAAVVLYLAIINAAVGLFNMLPGYPLDGGRVLRAALWSRGRNLLAATRGASLGGSVIGFGLMALGVVSILGGNFVGGAWFIVIGWFLRNVSDASYRQLLYRSTLGGTKVGELLTRDFVSVPPDISLNALVLEHMLARGQRTVAVVAGQELLGLITLHDLRQVPREDWDSTSVFKAMTPREKLFQVDVRQDVTEALEMMARENVHQLPVTEGGVFAGFISRGDVMRLMQLRSELAETQSSGAA